MPRLSDLTVRLGVDITDFQRRMAEFRRNFRELGGQLEEAGTQIGAAFTGIGVTIGAGLGMAIKSAANFEQALSNIKAVSGATAEEMAQLSKLAQDMGAQTKFSSVEAAQGIEELIKAGVSVADIMNGGLKGALSLAVAGNLELADAAEIASTALNAFKADGLNVVQAADILAGAANASATSVGELKYGLSAVSAVASSVGMTFEDTTAALAVFAQNGLKGSDAGTSLKTMLSNLAPKTNEQEQAFKKLGLLTKKNTSVFYDQNGQLKSLTEISRILQRSMGGLNDMQRQQYMYTMFGSDAIRASNILFKEGAIGVENMKKAMSKVTSEQVAAEKLNNLNGVIEQLKGSFETLMISLGEGFLPILKALAKRVQVVVDYFNSLSPETKKVVTAVLAVVAVLSTMIGVVALLAAGLGVLATAQWAAILPILGIVAAVVAGIAALTALGFAVVHAYKNWDWFRKVVDDTALAIKKTYEGLKKTLAPIANSMFESLKASFNDTKMFFIKNGPGFEKAFGNIFMALRVIFNEFVKFMTPIWNAWSEGMLKTFTDLWKGLTAIANNAIQIIKNALLLFINVFTGNWSGAWENIKAITSNVINMINNIVKTGFTLITNVTKTIFNTFKAYILGVWDGIYLGIKATLNLIIKGINTMIKGMNGVKIDVPDWVPVMGGKKFGFKIPDVPQLAQGGIVTKPTLAMIGEGRESEAVIPLSKLKDMLGSGGNGVTIENMHVRSDVDIHLIARELFNLSQTKARGGGRR